jgi:hypothetical protein
MNINQIKPTSNHVHLLLFLLLGRLLGRLLGEEAIRAVYGDRQTGGQ